MQLADKGDSSLATEYVVTVSYSNVKFALRTLMYSIEDKLELIYAKNLA